MLSHVKQVFKITSFRFIIDFTGTQFEQFLVCSLSFFDSMLNWCRPPNKLCFLVCSCSWKVSIITIYIFDFCFTLTGVAVIIFVTVYVCALIFMFVWWNKTVDWLLQLVSRVALYRSAKRIHWNIFLLGKFLILRLCCTFFWFQITFFWNVCLVIVNVFVLNVCQKLLKCLCRWTWEVNFIFPCQIVLEHAIEIYMCNR